MDRPAAPASTRTTVRPLTSTGGGTDRCRSSWAMRAASRGWSEMAAAASPALTAPPVTAPTGRPATNVRSGLRPVMSGSDVAVVQGDPGQQRRHRDQGVAAPVRAAAQDAEADDEGTEQR